MLVGLLMLPVVSLGRSTYIVPISAITNYIQSGQASEGTNISFPIFLTSTIVLVAKPVDTIFNTTETIFFGHSMKSFYQQIFDSQNKYDLTVRSVDVMDQVLNEIDRSLEMETIIDVNFRPNPSDQTLTQTEFRNIVVNLVNQFETQLVSFLKNHYADFDVIQSLQAYTQESATNNASTPVWLYVVAGVSGVIIIVSLAASYRLYKREWTNLPKYVSGRQDNISPFNDDNHTPSKDTDGFDDDEDNYAFNSNSFSFGTGSKVPLSQDPTVTMLPRSPPRQCFDSLDRSSVMLTLDTVIQSPIKEIPGTRVELWAPAGKLGVAIDVVDGRPIVWRLKPGSPLEGFLEKGDIIVALDEIDTSHMSAADVTSLMVRRMRQRRKIAYIRPGS